MPDIVSRIKIEAQGAEAAAREIRKLKEAYEDVASSARNLGPNIAGGDPFSAATSAPGGGIVGGQRSPAQVHDQVRTNNEAAGAAEDRLRNNQGYPTTQGGAPAAHKSGGVMSALKTGQNALTSAGQGQFGSAVGSVASGAAGLIASPWGIALAALGAGAYGTQQLANSEYDRIKQLWGSGQSQRLGLNYTTLKDWQATQGFKSGIPLESIQAFTSAASQSGFDATKLGAGMSAGVGLEAISSLGLDSSAVGSLLGTISKSGLGLSAASEGMYGAGKGTFGYAGMGTYISALSQSVESRTAQGINVTDDAFKSTQGMLAGLRATGLSSTAAAGLTGRLEARGMQASGLTSPEDILALTSLRGEGMSLTEAQIAMEENPGAVIGAVYGRMKRRYADNPDAMNMALRKYTGGTASETAKLIEHLESGRSYESFVAEGGDWITEGTTRDSAERKATSVKQADVLFALKESALSLTTAVGKMSSLLRGMSPLDARTVDFGDELPRAFHDAMASLQDGDAIPVTIVDGPPAGEHALAFMDPYAAAGAIGPEALAGIQAAAGAKGRTQFSGGTLHTAWEEVLPDTFAGIRRSVRNQYGKDSPQYEAMENALAGISNLPTTAMDTSAEVVMLLSGIIQAIEGAGGVIVDTNSDNPDPNRRGL